jgi:phage terminase large subunit-like protein
MSSAEQYARWVLDPENSFRTGRYIKLAAERFLSDLKRTDIRFDEVKATQCELYCERYLCLWEDKWRGKPMDFRPWMRFVFEQVFGWIKVSTGLRRFRKVYVQVAKKNAKSTVAGGLVDFHLLADQNTSTPSIFIGANNEEQARICLKIAGKILENSPEVGDWLADGDIQLFYNYGEINKIVLHPDPERDNREGTVTALSKEGSDKKSKTSGGKHGKNPSLIVIDEYGMAADDNQLNDMESGQAARDEPLLFVITTAGFNMDGPCFTKMRNIGIEVLEQRMEDDTFLPVIYEMDPPVDDDGKAMPITVEYLLANEQLWEQPNPNIDVSVSREFLRTRLQSAKNERGSKEVDVMTLNFNRWMDAAEVFIPSETWNKNTHGMQEEELLGQHCYGGIEIISGRMLNAFSFIFPNMDGKHPLKMFFWMPDEYQKNSRDFDQIRDWANDGLIEVFPGDVSDNDLVLDALVEQIYKYNMHSFAYRINLENSDIVQGLIRRGIQGNPISHGRQSISTPTSMWEDLFTAGSMEHFGNPVLAKMNSKCLVVRKENEIRLEKSGSRIIGIYAGINALAQWKTISAGEDNDQLIESWA